MSETATETVETEQAAREASGAHPYGRYLEEFEVGAVYKHWPAKTVTESDDHLFCPVSYTHLMSGRSSRSTFTHTKLSFISSAVCGSSKDSRSIT